LRSANFLGWAPEEYRNENFAQNMLNSMCLTISGQNLILTKERAKTPSPGSKTLGGARFYRSERSFSSFSEVEPRKSGEIIFVAVFANQ
jgi:hypothetical protein